jgi:hypothetical protein
VQVGVVRGNLQQLTFGGVGDRPQPCGHGQRRLRVELLAFTIEHEFDSTMWSERSVTLETLVDKAKLTVRRT